MKVMRIVVVLVILAALGGFGAFLYVSVTRDRHDGGALAGNAADTGSAAELGKLTPLDPPRPAPELSFSARDGSPVQLADFRGRWLLVNLWATWCAPCVREMPSLDRLQAELGDRLTVLAVSQDRGGAEVVDPFVAKLGLAALHIYLDPNALVGKGLGARGLPTTFLVDGEGRVRGQLEGAADWDSPAMLATLERYFRNADKGAGVSRRSEVELQPGDGSRSASSDCAPQIRAHISMPSSPALPRAGTNDGAAL